MNRRSTLSKTGKGLMEATGKTSHLSRELRNILKEIDGQVGFSTLTKKLDRYSESELLEALKNLERDGYVREFVGQQDDGPVSRPGPRPTSPASGGAGEDLDFTSLASNPAPRQADTEKPKVFTSDLTQQAAETRARLAAARAKAEAEAKARSGGQTQTNAEALDRARREAEDRAHKEAEEKTRREAEARIRKDAEERTRREAEEKTRRDAEQRSRRESEEKTRRETEVRARKEAEDRARKEAEARARLEAEKRGKLDPVEQARRDEEERGKHELEERSRREQELRLRMEEEERKRKEEKERAQKEEQEQGARKEQEEKARREAEEKARREEERKFVEERKRKEEKERAQREEEDRQAREAVVRALKEQEEKDRREAEEKVRREEERKRKEAEEKARREEEHKRKEAEEKARREEERKRKEREERERHEAEEKARAEEEARRQEEERAEEEKRRAKEEERKAKEEERKAKEEAKARAREEAEAAALARKEAREKEKAEKEEERRRAKAAARSADVGKPAREVWARRRSSRSIGKPIAVALLLLLVGAVAAIPFMSIDAAPYEKAAQAWLGQPVKIGSVSMSLIPIPQLKFGKIVIGKDPQMRIASIKASADIGSLIGDQKALKSIELEGVVIPREFLSVLFSEKSPGESLRIERISAKDFKLDIPELNLPVLDLDASLGADGVLRSVVLSNSERKFSVTLQPQGGKAAVEIAAGVLPLPIGGELTLEDFSAKGTVTASELVLNQFEGRAFDGRLQGNARFKWSDGWSLDGELTAQRMQAAGVAAPILAGGLLEGKATYSMKARTLDRLFINARLDGTFTVQKGSITNVDMARLLQGSRSGGGTTPFSEMSGNVSADPNRLQVHQLKLAAGLLSGSGLMDMDPQKNLSGRMQIELRAQSVQGRATLVISGTLKDPQFRRSN